MNTYKEYSRKWNMEVILNSFVDRMLNNIVSCSSLVMSDGGLLLELSSSHCRGQCESLYNRALRSSLPSGHCHNTWFA